MTKFLVKLFIKNSEDINNPVVRNKYGAFGGAVGIFLNICLFIGKIIAGLATASIAIIADAFNNLSDAGSSIITLVGFKMASKPADNKHPFGHGRFEYISGFTISMIIILVGFELGKTAVEKIINPVNVEFSIISIVILAFSVLVKLWMCLFNKKLGDMISSQTMKATAMDSLSDVMATSAVIVGVLISYFTGLKIDGYLGVAVALFIIFTGFSAAKGMLDQLLGEAPDKEFVNKIKAFVLSYPEIYGVHDVVVHNYAAGQCVISLHAEVPCDMDIMKIHDTIDLVEIKLKEQFSCQSVIHMDPIEVNDENVLRTAEKVISILKQIDSTISMHDFRMVNGETHTNLIFDVVVPFNFVIEDDVLCNIIEKKVREIDQSFYAKIEIDKEPM